MRLQKTRFKSIIVSVYVEDNLVIKNVITLVRKPKFSSIADTFLSVKLLIDTIVNHVD